MAPAAEGAILADRFRLDQVLGQGGMGVVWAATELSTEARVAVKLMKKPGDDAALRRRFLREARAAAAIEHPHIVRVLDVLELEDGPAIVMELLDGETLAERLGRHAPLGLGETAALLSPVVSAVGAAHALGIVHRDLKPENVFLALAGDRVVVKVLDFGIAKLTATPGSGQSEGMTTTGALLGTPAYMSPEQVFGEKDIDHRTDVWSIGMMLYECLSGILPTHADNVGQVIKIIITRDSWKLGEVVPDLPADVVELTERMLCRDRSARPPLRRVAEILERYAEEAAPSFGEPALPRELPSEDQESNVRPSGGSTLRSPHTRSSPGAMTRSLPTPLTAETESQARRSRSTRGWLAVGALLLLGGAGWWIATQRTAPPPTAADALASEPSPQGRPGAASPAALAEAGSASPVDAGSSAPPEPPAKKSPSPKLAPKGGRTDVWGSR